MLNVRWATLLFAILTLAVSGCGTLSGRVKSDSSLLVSPALPPAAAFSNAGENPAPPPAEPVAAAVSPESRTEIPVAAQPSHAAEPTTAKAPEFVPVSLDVILPDQPYLVAFSESLEGQTALAAPMLAQQRGKVETPPSDVQVEEYDPWERFNEKMFTFNYNLDKYVLKPVAKAYNFVMPDRVQQMIGHGFDNIKVLPRLVNTMLQLNWKGFGTELGRFFINSTLGIGGLFDIAKQEFNLDKPKGADFGVTLGKWGAGPGPFLILPLLPPLTVRDGIGYGVDGAMDPLSYVLPFIWTRLGMKIGETINDRSLNLDLFQGFEETTVDLYSAVRNGYLQRRFNLIHSEP